MIDAIDALLDKMDIFLDTFGGSFQWFRYLGGAMVALLVGMVVVVLGMRGKMAQMSRQLAAQHIMLQKLLDAQSRQNRLAAEKTGTELDPEDAPGNQTSSLRDHY